MSPQETPIVVSLDLSESKSLSIAELKARIPGRPHVQHVVTASECGAPKTDDGSPSTWQEWAGCRYAVERLASEVNSIAQECRGRGESVRLWIGGSAGLPVFFHLGLALSGWAPPITFVHRDRLGSVVDFPLDRPAQHGAYFDPLAHASTSGIGAEVALVVSCVSSIAEAQVAGYAAKWTDGFADLFRLHANDRLTEHTFAIAVHELASGVARLPPGPLTVFLLGPAPLALALGRLINRKRFTTISAPEFLEGAYSPALVLALGPRRRHRRSTDLSVVYFSANAREHQHLNLAGERDRIRLGLSASKRRHRFKVVAKTDPDALMETLRETKPSVLHFSGHGTPESIILEAADHGHVTITPKMLATALKHAGETVQVVVLNACYSESVAKALLEHVDCVIAISHQIEDEAAIAFSSDFYRDLGNKGVRAAHEIACNQLAMKQMFDHELIKLHAAPGVDLDDVWP